MFLRPSFKGPSSVLEMDILLECLYSGKSTQCSFQDPSLVANHPRPSHALSRLKAGGRDDCICGVGCQVSPPRLPGRRKLQNNQTLHSIVNFLLQVYFLPGLWFEVHRLVVHITCVIPVSSFHFSFARGPRTYCVTLHKFFILRWYSKVDNPDHNEVPNITTSHNWCYTLKFWLQLSQQNN